MGGSFEIISESLLDWIYLVVLVQKCIAQKNSNDYLGDVMMHAPCFFRVFLLWILLFHFVLPVPVFKLSQLTIHNRYMNFLNFGSISDTY